MKKIKIGLFVAVLAVIGALFVSHSCTKDPCEDVVCQNGGTCADGKCNCAAGYEGTNCETEWRTKLIGTFNGTENCGTAGSLSITVTKSSTEVKRVIMDIGNGINFYADMSTSTSGAMPTQTIASGAASISGSVSISGTQMTATYTITYTDGSPTDNCSYTGTKQ